jgi:para-aminobenzoate synthetase component 1
MEAEFSLPFALTGVHTERVVLDEPFITAASRFVDEPGTVLLMSGGANQDCARYHILGVRPWLTLVGGREHLLLSIDGRRYPVTDDPLRVLKNVLDHFHLNADAENSGLPVAAGLLGYLAYDLKDCLENLPRTSVDDLGLPHIYLVAPSVLLVQDMARQETWISTPVRDRGGQAECRNIVNGFRCDLSKPAPDDPGFFGGADGFSSTFSRDRHMEAVESAREYIRSGDIYQANISQRFHRKFQGSPFSLFRALFERNPAPFFAYIQAGDHQVVSTSPERFIYRDKDRVETRPIKGTRPRGKTPDEDQRLRDELSESPKDDAELSMIVDLLRNDIGKVCRPGTVRVSAHKRVEAYHNVYHLVSDVTGVLDAGKDSVDMIRATFPGGSITGCPKIRAMEIIDELEPVRRHVYTGAIGYISFHDTMDMSIAIRTATVCRGLVFFSVGGGIVFDSDPADEYAETLHKGSTLMTVFEGREAEAELEPVVWMDGSLMPQLQAAVPVASPGVQYGWGLFETIRAVNGALCCLDEHLKRFQNSWRAVLEVPFPDITWEDVIRQVLTANRLDDEVAAVKLMAVRAGGASDIHSYHLVVMARPYMHRLDALQSDGVRLAVYPESRQTPLADHKSLNHLYYMLAGDWARRQGADEALIVNPDGSVSETHTANLLIITGKMVIRPLSPHVLPGIMAEKAADLLAHWGFSVISKSVSVQELHAADHVLLTNSLMGAVPALSLDHIPLTPASALCRKINRELQ